MSGIRSPLAPSRQPSIGAGLASPVPSQIVAGGSSNGGTAGLETNASAASGATDAEVAGSASASAAIRLRRLIWDATIPVVIGIESGDLPLGSDRSVETYYASVSRISYLPLLLAEVRRNLLPLVLDDAALQKVEDKDCWFSYEGVPLRWHWPLGLLYDYHTNNAAPSSYRLRTSSVAAVVGPSPSLLSPSRRASASSHHPHHHAPTDEGYFPGPTASQSHPQASSQQQQHVQPQGPPIPWRLTLRLQKLPMDKLHSSGSLSACRASFMSMLKEADFVRYGSTKRVTNLRKGDQDQLWEGVLQHDFDLYWAVASKLVPVVPDNLLLQPSQASAHERSRSSSSSSSSASTLAGGDEEQRFNTVSSTATARPALTQQHNESQVSLAAASMHSVAPSEAPSLASASGHTANAGSGPSPASAVRSVPMRFHLIDGAPIVQEPVAPYLDDGRPNTIQLVLSGLFPLLFPPMPTFGTSAAPPPALAYPVVQGIRLPLETDVAWLGAALPSADGWVAVCINLLVDGEEPESIPPSNRAAV